jgi:hypothetical protein
VLTTKVCLVGGGTAIHEDSGRIVKWGLDFLSRHRTVGKPFTFLQVILAVIKVSAAMRFA